MGKTFKACKMLIEKGKIGDRNEFIEKLDILLLNNRLTQDEYESLLKAMDTEN